MDPIPLNSTILNLVAAEDADLLGPDMAEISNLILQVHNGALLLLFCPTQ